MLNDLVTVDKEHLLGEVAGMKWYGYRLSAISCEKEQDAYELIYHFDLNYSMKNLKVKVTKDEPIKSISNFYPAAFLIENEYQDLYGFTFEGLSIDYKGKLYLTEEGPKSPLSQEA